VPAGQDAGPVPVVTAALRSGPFQAVELTLASEGRDEIVYTLTPNDYGGSTQTITVQPGRPQTVSWPPGRDGYYDVVITASDAGGFRRRFAGRMA
jgi:phospholipase C